MNRAIVISAALAALQLCGAAHAGPVDFAQGRVLIPVDEAPVQHVLLPEDVYQWVMRDDLGDVRVFDGAGDEVPYALLRQAGAKEHTPWHALPLFHLPLAKEPAADGGAVNIELNEGGTVVAVHGARPEPRADDRYLLDASGYAHPLTELRFHWSGGDDVVARIRVEAADNLDDWRVVVGSATLASLAAGTEQVRLDRIALPVNTHAKYLRVSRLEGADMLIDGIDARSRQSLPPERHWKRLEPVAGEPVEGFEFDIGGRYPVDRLSVELDRDNYLLDAQLFSRDDPSHAWRPRGKRTFYRVAIDEMVVSSDPVLFGLPHPRYWRVVVLGDSSDVAPHLRVGWAPDKLVFATHAQGPYTLAYGRTETTGRQWPMRDLLRRLDPEQSLDDLPMASYGGAEILGGPSRLQAPDEPVDWQTVLLWVVLVLGVLIIGVLALRLLRQ